MKDSEIMEEKINVTINAWRVVLFLCCTRSMCSLWGCSVCLWPSHSLTHTHRCTSSPFTPFPRMIFNAHSKKKKKRKRTKHTNTWALPTYHFVSFSTHLHLSNVSHKHSEAPSWFGCPDTTAELQLSELCAQHAKHECSHTLSCKWW